MIVTCLFGMLSPGAVFAQNEITHSGFSPAAILSDTLVTLTHDTSFHNDEGNYNDDEILITLNVPRIGSIELPAYIYGELAYLPVKDLFDFLRIRNNVSAGMDSVEGFIISPLAPFLIDKMHNRITYQDKIFRLNPEDIIVTETNFYLRSDYYGKIFGLECNFNFRALSVTLNTKLELPAIREMQQELMRKNIATLQGDRKADTIIKRSRLLFHIGMADWGITSIQEQKGLGGTRANLNIGAVIAGGEANIFLNYDSRLPITMRRQYYSWRYVNNDNAILKQATLGKIFVPSISSLLAPVTGIQLTNTPTTYRRSFGTYTLSNITQPGWTVELYVNNVLINYTKADASGFFTFEVPMVYGTSTVKLRFYGPFGEEQIQEQNMSIPFNFVPRRQLEYSLTAGVVDDTLKGMFSRANMNYGLSNRITVGAGVEYFSINSSGKTMPYINASIRLGTRMLFSAEHAYGVRSKGLLNYRLPSNLQFDLSYTSYNKAQTVVRYNYHEEKKLTISKPFKSRKVTAFSRLTVSQYSYLSNALLKPDTKTETTAAEILLSAMFAGVSSNLTTSALFNKRTGTNLYSNFSMTFRLPEGIRLTPRAQYDYTRGKFSLVRAEGERRLLRNGYINIYYEKEMINHINSLGLGFRYNFSFAQTSSFARISKQGSSIMQSARGSLMYNGKAKYLKASYETGVGKGGLIIAPFLDINCNGLHEPGEPKASGLRLKANGGRLERNEKDTTLRIIGLEAYTNCFIELDNSSFENIAWQIKNQTLSVAVGPNELKVIEVPVAVVGEVSGTVSLVENGNQNGLGRIIVSIFDGGSHLIARTITESDGFFSFLGLTPGKYAASVDAVQLEKLNMISSPGLIFTIKPGMEGDVADGLGFQLKTRQSIKAP